MAISITATNTMARVNIHTAIPYSCDTFYYQLGDRLGIDRISKYATEFGYGRRRESICPASRPD